MPRGVPKDLEERRERHAEATAAMGERIRFYRLLRRKTMRELAHESGCSLHTIWRTETGRNQPRSETQRRIAGALGVNWWAIRVDPLPKAPEELPQREEEPELSFAEEPFEEDTEAARRAFGSPKLSREDRRKKQRAGGGQARGRKKKNRRKKGR